MYEHSAFCLKIEKDFFNVFKKFFQTEALGQQLQQTRTKSVLPDKKFCHEAL